MKNIKNLVRVLALVLGTRLVAQVCYNSGNGQFCTTVGSLTCCSSCTFITCPDFPQYNCYECFEGCTNGYGSDTYNCKF